MIGMVATLGRGGPGAAIEVTSVWDFLIKGGIMMIPIGICSLVVVAVVVERLVVLRRSSVVPAGFERGVSKALDEGGRESAGTYCRRHDSPISRVIAAGLAHFGRPLQYVERHVSSAGEHEVFGLRRRLRVLSVITAVAPLMGLTGTIFGMIKAFQTVALSGEALGKTEMLAEGIYEAMITTAAGLLVAIPTLILYHWISGKIERLVREMDGICVRVAERIATGDGAGHMSLAGEGEEGDAAAVRAGAAG
jgi:biopolymer transport protein ExbB